MTRADHDEHHDRSKKPNKQGILELTFNLLLLYEEKQVKACNQSLNRKFNLNSSVIELLQEQLAATLANETSQLQEEVS
jgi:sulfur relay (sulfurtransferase) DsrF/TusC family protein